MMPVWETQNVVADGILGLVSGCVSRVGDGGGRGWVLFASSQPGTAKLRVGGRDLSLRAWASQAARRSF
jgi:hypothetical protein